MDKLGINSPASVNLDKGYRLAFEEGELGLSSRATSVAIIALLAIAFALPIAAYWPGIMTWDAVREYGMALRDPIDDWHPPAMIWIWRQILRAYVGPGPMLLLQLGLYIAGWGLLAFRQAIRGHHGRAIAFAACSLFPIALVLEGAVLKDCLVAGSLLVSVAVLAPRSASRSARVLACTLLIFAATWRYNAIFACLPLLIVALPDSWRATRTRLVGAIVGCGLLLASAAPLANRAIGARPSGVELSQVLFDLGGITRFSGSDAFPPVGVARSVEVNRSCYQAELWDSYAWWTDNPCPIGWANVGPWFAAHHQSAVSWWLRAIAQHPVAYAEHRMIHFAANMRIVPLHRADPIIPPKPDRNDFGFDVPDRKPAELLNAAAEDIRIPFGLPIFWTVVSFWSIVIGWFRRDRLTLLAASSSLLFALSYAVLSVASDLRYNLWTMIGALVALVASVGWRKGRRSG